MPLFEWWPLQGANGYQVQISQDQASPVHPLIPRCLIPLFHTQESLGQRSLDHLGFGILLASTRPGRRLPTRRLERGLALPAGFQSQWRFSHVGECCQPATSRASDIVDYGGNSYELTRLCVAQDNDYWYFGFQARAGADMTYGLYLDLDHVDASGANSDHSRSKRCRYESASPRIRHIYR